MSATAIELDRRLFCHSCSGILLFGDLAGFGRVCKYAFEQMHTFDESGDVIGDRFRTTVTELLYRFFLATGISQAHCAGDGFLAALPCDEVDVSREISTILKKYVEVLDAVEAMNESIRDSASKIGSRLSIHFGKYRYGRIAGPLSFSTDFDGQEVIAVARMDDGLKSFVNGAGGGVGHYSRHWCAISAADALKCVGSLEGWESAGPLESDVKEAHVSAAVFMRPARSL